MCDIDCANLIDLSLEENNAPQKTDEHTLIPSSSESLLQQQGLLHFVSPPRKERHSLDNNPFDCVQKLANCQDDPFDIVEREACFKARLCAKPLVEVKLGNLLSLSDENLASTNYMETGNDGCKNKLKNFDLESESPPVTMIEKITVDGMDSNSGTDTDSTPGNSAELSSTSKLKKSMEYRKRLLKLSVANSAAFNSPVARRSSLDEGSDTMGTPVASTLMKSTFLCEYSLAAESPLKFVDDDIMSEEPPPSLDAEKNFEADLEMLKIPMLSELQSPLTQNMSPVLGEKSDVSDHENNTPINKSKILDLEAIKTRLKARREETNNNNNNSHQQDINSLICDLKSLINCGDMINSGKQMQVSSLLESLSSALNTSQTEDSRIQSPPQICPSVQPQTIKRQGTFDMELQETNKSDDDLAKQPLVSEMPNCMVSSSATYDGETAEDKQDLNLPEIDPPSPQSSNCGEPNEITLQHDVNDIVEQLSKLLIHNNSADGHQTVQPNPTFIVVMNTTPMPQHNNSVSVIAPTARQNAAMMSSYIENSSLDDSPELHSSTTATRRRSQSLSLHDKVKIVQLPLQPPTPKTLQRQHSMTMDDSSSVTTTPPPKDTATTDFKTPEFKTPARMVRRNSYSSGTPYTVTVGLRRTGTSSDPKTPAHSRMTPTLDTHHEGQQQKAIVRPMANSLPSFKPDLKKKHKLNTDSIMKASGPLKATIPVKKVAPMLKTSPPTPDTGHTGDFQNNSQTKRIPTTPMAAGRSSVNGGVAAGYPNACSTPSITTPMKRSAVGGLPKPRYSYLSATPNAKTVPTATNTSALKRRTISEFKAKSPLKPRLSSTGSAAASSSARSNSTSRLSTSTRLSTSSSARLTSKSTTATKLGANTATVRPTGRTSGSRLPPAGSASSRNKENKHP